ncbi:MAG: FxLYD domain-containing protein [Thermoproteota archaeon]|nr:FxLYD domain-containing protein [Thermoproteota archaeon]
MRVGITKQGKREAIAEPLYQVIGKITNTGNLTATDVYVTATFYDAAGRMATFQLTNTFPSEIPPGQSADFIVETLPTVHALMGDYGNWTSTKSIASANVTVHSTEYLSMIAPP